MANWHDKSNLTWILRKSSRFEIISLNNTMILPSFQPRMSRRKSKKTWVKTNWYIKHPRGCTLGACHLQRWTEALPSDISLMKLRFHLLDHNLAWLSRSCTLYKWKITEIKRVYEKHVTNFCHTTSRESQICVGCLVIPLHLRQNIDVRKRFSVANLMSLIRS